MRKNILAIFLSLIIPVSLISCSNKSNSDNNENNNISTKAENNNSNNNKDIDDKTEEESLTNIYYYDTISDKIVYVNKSLKFTNNEITSVLIDELKKSPNSDIPATLSSEINLNSSNLDIENSTINLDFSSNFISAQNLGSSAESKTLTAICNTFGDFFDIENVIITLDGQPYSSGHIFMNEKEPFKVNFKDSVELK